MTEVIANMTEILTNDELDSIGTLLVQKQVRLDDPTLKPIRDSETPVEGTSLLVLEQQGRVRLSKETRKLEIQRMARAAQKRNSLRYRKRYTRRRGTVHPQRKAATQRRNRKKAWERNPLACVLAMNDFKCKRIDQDSWARLVNPLWTRYDPKDLTVVFPRKAGTRADPWTVYNMTVIHKELGVVYNGPDQLLYDLSGGIA